MEKVITATLINLLSAKYWFAWRELRADWAQLGEGQSGVEVARLPARDRGSRSIMALPCGSERTDEPNGLDMLTAALIGLP